MASAREMRMRIRSVKNISQVTRALEAVSASKVRKAMAAVSATRAYASKAWQVLTHIARQPGRENLHPLLTAPAPGSEMCWCWSSAGTVGWQVPTTPTSSALSPSVSEHPKSPVRYIAVGRKGRDLLMRRRKQVIAEFSNLPAAPSFADVSAIGRMAVEEFLKGEVDEVYLVYTDFINMARQETVVKKLLPLEVSR